jgi:hypothetical protein
MKQIFHVSIAIILFSIFIIAAESTAVCLEPPSGMVSWWPGDGNASDIIGPNDGRLKNGTTFAPGMVKEAFSFDGVDDYVQANGTNIHDLQQLTIDAWLKHNSLPPGQIQRYVTINGEKAVLRYDGGAGAQQLHFYMRIDGVLRDIRVNNVLQVGVLHHVAGTYDGSVMRLYLDGVEIDDRVVSGTVGTGGGVALSSPGETLDGLLDEVEIYSRALSASEIQAIFNAGSEGKCRGTGAMFIDSGQNLGNSRSIGLALGDVDGDKDLDAFVANYNQPNKVWLNDGSGSFFDSGQSLGSSNSSHVALGDVNGDGDLDAFVANDPPDPNKVWLNNGSGSFTDSGQSLGNSASSQVALGDVDGDGDLDAFVANIEPNKVWLNDGSGSFTDSGQNLGSSNSLGLALGDVDVDGDLDAFVANHDGGQPNKVWLNDGSGSFTDSGQNLGSSCSDDLVLGDMDGDENLDAFVANLCAQPNKVWLNDGSGSFTDSGQNLGSSDSDGLALGDVDGDGDLDAFVANTFGQANRVRLNTGSGSFIDSGQRLGSSASSHVALGDVDGDRDLDAFVANADGQANKVWLNIPFCECDSDTDGDVDGSDLAILIDSDEVNIDVFAVDFGRTDCPQLYR